MDGENHLLPNHTLGCRALTALPPRAKPTQIIPCSNFQKLPGPPAPLLLAEGIFPSLWGGTEADPSPTFPAFRRNLNVQEGGGLSQQALHVLSGKQELFHTTAQPRRSSQRRPGRTGAQGSTKEVWLQSSRGGRADFVMKCPSATSYVFLSHTATKDGLLGHCTVPPSARERSPQRPSR